MPGDTTIEITIDPSLLEHVTEELARKKYRFQPEEAITFLVSSILDHSPYPIRAKRTASCFALPWRAAGQRGCPRRIGSAADMLEVWSVCTVCLGRRRLPGETPVKLEGGLRLAVEVPAQYRLEPILPSGRTSGRLDRLEMPR